ncbi:MAG: hypothetical protein V2B15_15565 [Bacteroidota bacterium]
MKKIILIFIMLCSLEFYHLAFIPETIVKAIELTGLGTLLVFFVLYMVYGEKSTIRKRFLFPVILFFIASVLAMIGAYVCNDQKFINSLYAERAVYFYLVYFLLHAMKIETRFIVRVAVAFGVFYILLYFIQYFIYPVRITSSPIRVDRETLRIWLDGFGYLVIAYYIWLNRAASDFKWKYVLLLMLSLGVYIMMGTRQILAVILLLSLLYLFQSRVIRSKLLIFLMFAAGAVAAFFIFEDIILAMFQQTLEQSGNLEGSIRLRAIDFFMTRFYGNKLAYFTGNGVSYSSVYELRTMKYEQQYGFFVHDIGLVGEYFNYGAVYVVGALLILYKAIRAKLPEEFIFARYHFIAILLTVITAGGSFVSFGESIFLNCLIFYVIDREAVERSEERIIS